MTAHRLTGLAMVTLLVVAAALTPTQKLHVGSAATERTMQSPGSDTGWRLQAVAFWLVAVVGASGYLQVSIRRSLRVILALAAALLMVGLARALSGHELTARLMVQMAPYYFLTLIVASFFVRRRPDTPLPPVLVLYAVMVLISLPGMSYRQSVDVIFGACSVALAVGIALFFATARPTKRTGTSRVRSHHVVTATTLAITIVGAAALSSGAAKHQNQVLGALRHWARLFERRSTPGFGDKAKLNEIFGVKARDMLKVAVRIESDRSPGYLGGRAFVTFNSNMWHALPVAQQKDLLPAARTIEGITKQPSPWHLFAIDAPGAAPWRVLTVHPDNMFTRALLRPAGTTVVQAPVDRLHLDPGDDLMLYHMRPAMSYAVYVPTDRTRSLSPELAQWCRNIPADLDPRVKAVADTLFPEPVPAAQAVRIVENYFHKNYRYSLDIRVPRDQDPMGYFLGNSRPDAHCEYFATAAALLLRFNKTPTRYVTGFVATEYNDVGDYWVARNGDAHAWVEAWDETKNAWVRVEATPAGGVPHSAAPRSWQWVDLLRFQITRLAGLLKSEGLWGLFKWLIGVLDGILARVFTLSGMTITTALSGSVVLIWLAVRRRRPGYATRARGPQTPMQRLLAKVDRRVRRALGLRRGTGETVLQFALRLGTEAPDHPLTGAAQQWYRQYALARYGASDVDEACDDLSRRMPARGRRRK